MICRLSDLQDLAYGFLDEEDAARVRVHAAGCARCAADLARLEGERGILAKAAARADLAAPRLVFVPLAFAAALLAGLVWLLVPPRSPEPAAAPAFAGPLQEKKRPEAAPPDEESLRGQIAKLEAALQKTPDKEDRVRIQASIDDLRLQLSRLREGKLAKEVPEMKGKLVKKGPGRYDELTKALEKDPGDAAAWLARAEECLKTKRWDEGARDARKAVELAPQNAQAHRVLGQACALLKMHEEAEKAFARARELDPKLAGQIDHYKRTAQVQQELEAVYGKMKMSSDPEEKARLDLRAKELGQELKLLSQGDRVMVNIKEIEIHLQKNPNDAAALVDRATWHLDAGRAEPALKDLDLAIELKPDLALAWLKRGVAHAMRGEPERAWSDARRGEELDPKNQKRVQDTYGTIKKLSQVQKDQRRSAPEIEQQIEGLRDRVEELRAMAAGAELAEPRREAARKEAERVQAEIERLSVELKTAPPAPEKKAEKKK
jgi:tetratricopeptide (TPR) repeat protein